MRTFFKIGAVAVLVIIISIVSCDKNDGGTVVKIPSENKHFDLVTYNVRWLGKPDKANLSFDRDEQISRAAKDILKADADIYALQELVIDSKNGDALSDLLDELNSLDGSDSWSGGFNEYFSYWWNPDFDRYPAQRQAFVYRNSSVKNVTFQTLLIDEVVAEDNRFASGRLPFMMEADVTFNGTTEHVYIVNLHLKCCKDNDDRRLQSMEALVGELNLGFHDVNVVVMGDMNVADYGGAYGEISSWGIYNDNDFDGTDDYFHAAGSVKDLSYSDIDHILISDELKDELDASPEEFRNQIIESTVSDHDMVKTSLLLQ